MKKILSPFVYLKFYLRSLLLLGTRGNPSDAENRITIFINFMSIFSILGSLNTYFVLHRWGVKEPKYLFFYFCIPVICCFILTLNYLKKQFLARVASSIMLNITAWNALVFYGKSFNGYLLFYVAIIFNVMSFSSRKSRSFWILLSFPIVSLYIADYLSYNHFFPITEFHSSQAPFIVLLSDTLVITGFIVVMLLIEKFLADKNEHDLKILNQDLETIVSKRTELLNIARSEALQASDAKSQFVANTSHELRTPLGAIIGFIDLIASSNSSPEEKKQYIEVIKRNANQLLQIVNEVLDLSKIEAEKLQIEKETMNLNDLMDDIRLLMSLKAEDKGLEFRIVKSENLPKKIFSDALRLKQILINLIGNAIKFTDVGRVIVDIKVEESNNQKYLIFDISDTGPGISPDYDKDLFKPFSQADSTYVRKFGGTGLGLSLSQKLAQLLGGELTLLASTLGKGSTFQLKIECVDRDTQVDPKVTQVSNADNQNQLVNKKILIVDDAPDNLFLISRYLTHAGASVDTAKNGEEAIEKAKAHDVYDLILMDLQMPIMDGYEAVRIIKQQKDFKTPIIAFTADAMKGERWKSHAAGFAGYLTKPVDRQNLIDTIARLSVRL